MKKSGFMEEQIIDIFARAGSGIEDSGCLPQAWNQQRHVFKWKSKYGSMDVSEARKVKMPEDENAKLKKLLVEAMLDNAMPKDLNEKNADAHGQTGSRGSSHPELRVKPAAGVQDQRGGPYSDPYRNIMPLSKASTAGFAMNC